MARQPPLPGVSREMGLRVQRAAPKDLDKKKKKAADKQDPSERTAKRKQEAAGFGYTDILEAAQDVEDLTYRPHTACAAPPTPCSSH